MKTPILFKIRVIKNQIAACLREIAKGVKKYILDLCDLEQQLEKLTPMNQEDAQDNKMERIYNTLSKVQGAKKWENHGKKRVYFNIQDLLELSNNQAKRRCYDKFFFDIKEGFGSQGLSDEEYNFCVKTFSWV